MGSLGMQKILSGKRKICRLWWRSIQANKESYSEEVGNDNVERGEENDSH